MSSPEGRPCQDGQNHLVRFQMLLCALPPPEAPRGFPPLRMPDAECPAVLEAARGSAAAAASLESASLRGVDSSSGSSPRRPAEVSASVNRDSL